jgi:hypothetical protein
MPTKGPATSRVDGVGNSGQGFDFNAGMRVICTDMVRRLPELAHIDFSSVAVSFSQTRKRVTHGLLASLTPLRFEGGAKVSRDGCQGCQTVRDAGGHEYLYILTFYLPRFLNHRVEEKLATIVHELWHISPACDGDLRRHAGRCYAHGGSQEKYDSHVRGLARKWLALDPPHGVYSFLEHSFDELVEEHGRVSCTRIPVPKLISLEAS